MFGVQLGITVLMRDSQPHYAPLRKDAWIAPDLFGPDADAPFVFQPLAPDDAFSFNQSVPISKEPNPPAAPFILSGADATSQDRALQCLTAAVYYEAASETLEGQQAVAQVVLNRVRHPAFANSVCGVVYTGSQRKTGCQFTFTCDGSLARAPSPGGIARARAVARAALSGYVMRAVGHATHYHTQWVAPYWSPSLTKVAVIGAHIFYRWSGRPGQPRAFVQRYAGAEPSAASLAGEIGAAGDDVTAEIELLAPSVDDLGEASVMEPVTSEPTLAPSLPEVQAESASAATLPPPPVIQSPTAAPPPAAPPVTSPLAPEKRKSRIARPSW